MPPQLLEKSKWESQYLAYFEVIDFEESEFFAVYECRENAHILRDSDQSHLSLADKMKLVILKDNEPDDFT